MPYSLSNSEDSDEVKRISVALISERRVPVAALERENHICAQQMMRIRATLW
jgi:hypothetical protein